jgi:peptide-methionine (S)-S-oxide reductase
MSIARPLAAAPRTGNEFATLGGGCFWCLESVFDEVEGVVDVESGYAGGHAREPGYRQVCEGTTGHAEVVRIEFDPTRVSYRDLLEIFFTIHDPTTRDRQGNDVGTQYRSAIFYANDEQKKIAEDYIAELTKKHVYDKPIVTTLEPLKEFYPAETYHQNYVCNNPNQGYVRAVALPKVDKVRHKFADDLKETSPLDKK